jgi:hypothetical protein
MCSPLRTQTTLSGDNVHQWLLEEEFDKFGCKLGVINDDGEKRPEEDPDAWYEAPARQVLAWQVTERSRHGTPRKAQEGKLVLPLLLH